MSPSLHYLSIVLLISSGQGNQLNDGLSLDKDTTKTLSANQNSIREVRLLPDVEVEFDDFIVRLYDYSFYRDPKRTGDTIHLETEVGKSLENKLVQIIPKEKTDKFNVFETLERNLTVSLGEKQREDLTDWKKIETYKELKDSSNHYYKTIRFYRKEKEKELSNDFQKIKTRVLELKGEYITESLDSVTNLKYLPVELWVSRVIIKIVRTKSNGTRKTYYINAISPWGC